MPRSAEYPDGHFLGWTPGQIAPLVQPELAWTLEPGSDLVVQLHMQPTGAAEEVLPEIGFYFSDRAPQRTPTILRLGSQGIDIPPGDPRYVIRDSYVLPVDVQLLAIQPHAHYRAKEIRGVATLPDGTIAPGDAHQGLGFPLAARVSRGDADSAAERARGCRWNTPTTTRRRTSAIPSCRRRACSGGNARATRWATSGSSCSRRTSPIARA